MLSQRLGVGFVGSGFNTQFHIKAWRGVRDADVLGVWSPNAKRAAAAATLARDADVGSCKGYSSIGAMVGALYDWSDVPDSLRGDGRRSGDRGHLALRP